MKFRDKIILGLLLVLFASGIAMAGRYILRSGDVIFFDAITRHGVSSMAGDGLSGGDSTLEVDFGTTANTACEGNDARIPSTDEKAAMTGANSPSASNVFATMTDVSAGETGVELITTTSPIDDDGSAEQPNIIIASGYAVPTDAEKGHYDLVVLDSPIWQATSDKVDADSLVWADKYTQAEADALLLDKADTPHDHNNLYYTESEADALLLDKADTPHAHDDRYYTESESDALLLDKADTPHAHDDRYYTETELDAGQLDNRYYTETESNSLLADKVALADSALHQHVEADITDLDKYSQSEVDTLLLDKVSLADSDLHQHTESDITDLDKYTTSEADALLDLKVNLTDTGIWEAAAAEVNADSGVWEDKYTKVEADLLLDDKANQSDTPNWNTAYGWGDHADQNYFDIDIDTLDDVPDGSTYKLSHNDFSDAYKAELDAAVADSYLDVGQKAAIDTNTAKVTESTTVTSPLVLTTYDISIPAATNAAAGHASAAHITAIEANTTDSHASASDNQNLFEEVRTDTGTTSADSQTDTLWITGGTNVNVYSSGDTIIIESTASGGGAGDMLKSTYDPDEDGKIAEAQLKLYIGTIELWKAIQILAFRQNNFEYMIDGYNNPFDVENEGIDTALSDTYLYDATGDYYYQDTTAGATTTLDMMEYSTSELAQAAYVSSDKADDYTKLLLHLNGADEATSTIDDSDSGHSITFNGTAQLDTAQKVFGTASLLLDGNSDYLSMVDHADFDLGTDDFTIDFWIRRDGDQTTFAGTVCACSGDTGWIIRLTSNGKSELVSNASGIWALDMTSDTALSDTTWTHLALVRNGNTIKMYLGGVEVATCDCTGYTYDCGGAGITIGLYPAPGGNWYFKGHIDEIRISKGIARWTSNFTPPVTEYPHLECYSESTIKTQGDYSLKGVAVITDSLNDTLTRTVDPTVDLSGKDDWVFYIYSADRTGSNIKAGIHDSGGTTTESTPDVTDTGVWQKVTVDVSGVTDANKDVIDSIIITPVNADASNTFYLDNVFGQAVATGGGNMELYTSYYQIGLDSANVKAMILSNKEPTSVSLTRTGTGTSLTEGVLSDSDVYNSTYYSFNYSADVSGESSDTCIRAFIESSDTTIHFYGISLLGLE